MTDIGSRLGLLINKLIRDRRTIQLAAQRKVSDHGHNLNEKIVIDSSSPNIAKPFHYGHLKSTIVGNYLANINKFLGNQVVKVNYIGDWGTQYGILNLALEGKDLNELGTSPIRSLLDIYVEANARAKEDEKFYNEAKRTLASMSPEQFDRWLKIRDISLTELRQSYKKLGVDFDVFEYESEYDQQSIDLVSKLQGRDFISKAQDGAIIASVQKNNKILEIPLLKSDGSSLYITRDVAAAIKRMETFNFDKLLYVVGANQEKHFHCLKEIIKKLGYDWHDRLVHVKMGKVIGMSSRAGSNDLLSDIVEKATEQYIETTKRIPTTKVKGEEDIVDVGSHLALSALFVFDMRNTRTRNYDFDWELVMSPGNKSGINLQTTFARISSLLQKALESNLMPFERVEDLSLDGICCQEALDLLVQLEEFPDCLLKSHLDMNPKPLIDYGFRLCTAINRARHCDQLQVLLEPNEKWARTRLTLFKSSHSQLKLIIELIGLKPLYKV